MGKKVYAEVNLQMSTRMYSVNKISIDWYQIFIDHTRYGSWTEISIHIDYVFDEDLNIS